MVVITENYENRRSCETCKNKIIDEEVSIVHKRKWYHVLCWLKDKSIKTKKRDPDLEELEVY